MQSFFPWLCPVDLRGCLAPSACLFVHALFVRVALARAMSNSGVSGGASASQTRLLADEDVALICGKGMRAGLETAVRGSSSTGVLYKRIQALLYTEMNPPLSQILVPDSSAGVFVLTKESLAAWSHLERLRVGHFPMSSTALKTEAVVVPSLLDLLPIPKRTRL